MQVPAAAEGIASNMVQDKVLAQLEKEGKPLKKEPKKGGAKKAAAGKEEEDEEEADPVEAALTKYGIITENPWEKGVK